MKHFIRLTVCLSLLLCAQQSCPAQKKNGQRPKQKTPAVRFDQKVYDNLWAVVIGINKYKQWDRLEYAVNDAKSIRKLLIEQFGFPSSHILELIDQDATLLNIRTTLGGVLPQRVQKNDGVLIFFAGHGETVDLPDGGNLGYLVPVDGSREPGEYFATLLPMTQIREICNLIPAKHIFFVVDACYSGLAAASERGMSTDDKLYVAKLAALRSRQILTAGGRGEPVVEKAEWGHSAFTYKLLEGLESGTADLDQDGVITATEIATYIKSRVPRISDNKQTPQFKNLTNDEGDFIFIRPEHTGAKADTLPAAAESEDTASLRKMLEKANQENERLRRNQDENKKETKKEEKKNEDIVPPPP